MADNKIAVLPYLGSPLYFNPGTSVNDILMECAHSRKITSNSRKGFLLICNGYYLIPSNRPLYLSGKEAVYYRYVDYHTDRNGLHYLDSQCFEYVYHQYKSDVRIRKTIDTPLLIELLSLEILIMAMIFGDPLKPQNYIKAYKDLTENTIVNIEAKETKKMIVTSLKQFKSLRTEYECMEKYIEMVDNNMKLTTSNKLSYPVILDLAKNVGLTEAVVNVYREKLEIFENLETSVIGSKRMNRELHSVRFSDPKLYIKAAEKDLKVDIFTQAGRFGIVFYHDDEQNEDEFELQRKRWGSFVALLNFYINLEHPRSRKEAAPCEIVWSDDVSDCLINPKCAILVPVPPIHYKLTRQDCRIIFKKYCTQDGWYMFSTFEASPKKDENRTNGIITLSYAMNNTITHVSVNFSQENGFGQVFYRTEEFRGKKFCSLFELASHISIRGKRLDKFITESMIEDVAVPESVTIPPACLEVVDHLFYKLYLSSDDKKHDVEKVNLPEHFRFANFRIKELEVLVRELCDYNSVHNNVMRLFGLCIDEKSPHIKIIQESFGTNLYDYLVEEAPTDYKFLLNIAYQLSCGIQSLHFRQLTHGFPALHNCRYNPLHHTVKLGQVGILRISVSTHRLDGVTLPKEELPFENEVVLAAARFHPARWLPPETLFDYEFTEDSDRWCFGSVLWQLFSNFQIPFPNISNEKIVEQLKMDKEMWFKPNVTISNPNKVLEVMVKKTIEYCNQGDSMDKVVNLLDPRMPDQDYITCYNFFNLDSFSADDYGNIELANIQGTLKFINDPDGADASNRNYSYDKLEEGKNCNLYSIFNENQAETSLPSLEELADIAEDEEVFRNISIINPADVAIKDTIGQGQFAIVKKGILTNERNPDGIEVAIKIYHPDIKASDIEKEIYTMNQLQHDNIIPLKGVLRGDETWLIMNFYIFGSLDKYIEQNSELPVTTLSLFASQIAEGMQYLANKNFVHRDLSSRNVLVQSHKKVRIADLGLSRSIEKQYYKHKKNGFIPYLWYPPEFFETQTYGKSSDVWSYGITCYEIFNNAEVPYLYCDPPITEIALLLDFFRMGKTPPLPAKATPLYKTIITNCWKTKSERWTFNNIVKYINCGEKEE